LLGIPHRLVVGDRSLKEDLIEYRHRGSGNEEKIAIDGAIDFVRQKIDATWVNSQ
jgi:prolyl-tRNA synthetase